LVQQDDDAEAAARFQRDGVEFFEPAGRHVLPFEHALKAQDLVM
jgi:hypothetical protein